MCYNYQDMDADGIADVQHVDVHAGEEDVGAETQQLAVEATQEEQPSSQIETANQNAAVAVSQPVADEKVDIKTIVAQSTQANAKKEGFGNVVSISDMTWYTTDIEVEAACSQFGVVRNIKFFEDRSNGRSMGHCVVEFDSHEQARSCIEGLTKKKIAESDVTVSWPGKTRPMIPKNRSALASWLSIYHVQSSLYECAFHAISS
jgi:RNA recognition motif-containing protein